VAPSLIRPPDDETAWRRARTIPLLFALALIACMTAPALFLAAVLVDAVRHRGLASVRVVAFMVTYLASEVVGVIALALAWVRHAADRRALLEATYQIQAAWTRTLLRAVTFIFSLRFDVRGDTCVNPGPVIVLCRHASIVDTLLPSVFLTQRHGVRLRFVLKKELLLDPCLDIAGNRLPNHFVSRTREGSTEDLRAVEQLARDLPATEGVLIFPEGTRFSPEKRARALETLAVRDPPLHAIADTLAHTLPPKLGGVTALLRGAPHADLIFMAHTGLEGFSHVKDIWRGAMNGQTVRVRAWRVPRAQVPQQPEELRMFLVEQWRAVDRAVGEMRAETRALRAELSTA
jgi:1-acyl-sn-glycerol-3-phosphate acyltransferase